MFFSVFLGAGILVFRLPSGYACARRYLIETNPDTGRALRTSLMIAPFLVASANVKTQTGAVHIEPVRLRAVGATPQ